MAGCVVSNYFFIRRGRNLGNKIFYPKVPEWGSDQEILNAFLSQYYLGKQIPREIVVSTEPQDKVLLEQVLSEQSGSGVKSAVQCAAIGPVG